MENLYYILMMVAIIGMGCFVFLAMQIKRLALNMMEHEHQLASLDKITENHMDMISKLCVKVQELDKELDSYRQAMQDWSEAAFEFLKSSPALFARKFNSREPQFLEKIVSLLN